MDLRSIGELDELEQIESIAARYLATFGSEPLNLSHWDPSAEFKDATARALRFEHTGDVVPYIYSYSLEPDALLRKLGFDPAVNGCLVTPGGTASMLCVANWLSARRVRSLEVLCPFYFPIVHQARLLGIATERSYMRRIAGRYVLPDGVPSRDATLWATSPVYCTGVSLNRDDRVRLQRWLATGGTLIADECLALAGQEIGRELGIHPGFVGIYTPDKTICLNGAKFSVVVFDRSQQSFFDQWSDILCGGLSVSAHLALKHFLSPNFAQYDEAFRTKSKETLLAVKRLAALCPAGELDSETEGHFVTFYMPTLAAELGSDEAFLWRLAHASAAVVIPGTRNHFDPAVGFCFRINLALDSPTFRGALGRLFRFLDDYSRV